MKTVLIPKTTFTATERDGNYVYSMETDLINAEKITVVFDGVTYANLPVAVLNYAYGYGGVGESDLDFSKYPFAIESYNFDEGDIS